MLSITELIEVLALCATFYCLGYMHGEHNTKTHR